MLISATNAPAALLVNLNDVYITRDTKSGSWKCDDPKRIHIDIDLVYIDSSDDLLGLYGLYEPIIHNIDKIQHAINHKREIMTIVTVNGFYRNSAPSNYAEAAMAKNRWKQDAWSDVFAMRVKS
jgi:hypothetical protein